MISKGHETLEISQTLWNDVPDNIAKILQILQNSLSNQTLHLRKLESNLKVQQVQIPEKHDNKEEIIREILSKVKENEQQSSRKAAVITTKLNTKIEHLESTIEAMQNGIQDFDSKMNLKPVYQAIEDAKYRLKKELIDENISPFESELKEFLKTINLIDQQVKIQTWNIEASLKEVNSRFEIHREKICKVENIASEFATEVDGIILEQIGPYKEMVKNAEDNMRHLYSKFKRRSERVLSDFREKESSLLLIFRKSEDDMEIFKSSLNKMIRGITAANVLHLEKLDASFTQVNMRVENLKTEIRFTQQECYDQAKAEVMKFYAREMALIQEKLRWLPPTFSEITSDMTPIEARLFTIETRIKTEEVNRINQVDSIFHGIAYVEMLNFMKYRGEKKHRRESAKISIPTSRSITPKPNSTKICKSPGGMRLLTSGSNRKIRNDMESILKNR